MSLAPLNGRRIGSCRSSGISRWRNKATAPQSPVARTTLRGAALGLASLLQGCPPNTKTPIKYFRGEVAPKAVQVSDVQVARADLSGTLLWVLAGGIAIALLDRALRTIFGPRLIASLQEKAAAAKARTAALHTTSTALAAFELCLTDKFDQALPLFDRAAREFAAAGDMKVAAQNLALAARCAWWTGDNAGAVQRYDAAARAGVDIREQSRAVLTLYDRQQSFTTVHEWMRTSLLSDSNTTTTANLLDDWIGQNSPIHDHWTPHQRAVLLTWQALATYRARGVNDATPLFEEATEAMAAAKAEGGTALLDTEILRTTYADIGKKPWRTSALDTAWRAFEEELAQGHFESARGNLNLLISACEKNGRLEWAQQIRELRRSVALWKDESSASVRASL